MEFRTLETLVLALLFGVPGVVFLLVYSREPSAAEGIAKIRRDIPFELVAFYITASCGIHCLLLPILLLLLNYLAWYLGDPHVLSRMTEPLLNMAAADIQSLTRSVLVVSSYFGVSLAVAYISGRWWGRRYIPLLPSWLRELFETLAACHAKNEHVALRLVLRDGTKHQGWLESFQWNRQQSTFEVTCRLPGKSGVVWVDSSNLAEMTARCGEQHRVFLLHQRRKVEKPNALSNVDSLRQELNQVRGLHKWFIGLAFVGLLSIAISNLFRRLWKD